MTDSLKTETRRAFVTTTTVYAALRVQPDSSLSTPEAVIFWASLEHGPTTDRLVVTNDIRGVLDLVVARSLVEVPDFETPEDRHRFWRKILDRVEVNWDHAELGRGSDLQLAFRTDDSTMVALTGFERAHRLDISVNRSWILEPQPA